MAKIGETIEFCCNGCIACCLGGARIRPEYGDNPYIYETETDALGNEITKVDDSGMCIYAREGVGCLIYDKRPAECRAADPREWGDNWPGKNRRES